MSRARRAVHIILTLLLAAVMGGGLPAAAGAEDASVELVPVFPELSFKRPVAMVQAPAAPGRWYVVEQRGVVWRVEGTGAAARAAVFADIRERVDDGPNEAGLLGMALHPDFAGNGAVFLSYTAEGPGLVSRISRFRSPDGGLTLAADSERPVLSIEQPYGNHNGGHLAFGPDGYLYAGYGDGGAGGDPHDNAQDPGTLLGTLLRLDVDGAGEGGPAYTIPPDNPFAGGGAGRPEVYAWGLRNPWRFAFDPETGVLWAGDVGQNQWEEIDVIRRGGNYGWNHREGAHCYRSQDCRREGLIDPVAEYSHAQGCSVTGGHVYRGRAVPALKGRYIFADYCSGRIWTLAAGDTAGPQTPRPLLETGLAISSFARDDAGEVYVIAHDAGRVFRFAPR